MAGVTDRPFRQLCREQGAGLVVSEMVSSNALLWGSKKTRRRIDHSAAQLAYVEGYFGRLEVQGALAA
jgi:tRNA-dihydrouridine synthase